MRRNNWAATEGGPASAPLTHKVAHLAVAVLLGHLVQRPQLLRQAGKGLAAASQSMAMQGPSHTPGPLPLTPGQEQGHAGTDGVASRCGRLAKRLLVQGDAQWRCTATQQPKAG